MNRPHLTPIKNGWAAVGHGWAVFAESRDQALERYREAERKHDELRTRAVATPDQSNASEQLSERSPNAAQV